MSILVVVVGAEHPHLGCRGHIETSPEGTVQVYRPAGMTFDMLRVTLTRCEHGTEACFAKYADLRHERRDLEVRP